MYLLAIGEAVCVCGGGGGRATPRIIFKSLVRTFAILSVSIISTCKQQNKAKYQMNQ